MRHKFCRINRQTTALGEQSAPQIRPVSARFCLEYCCFNMLIAHYYKSRMRIPASQQMKWNESGFRPPLCTYRLNWARRTSWGWWYDWDDTVLQTQDSKFESWRSEAEYATSRSRRLPTILTFTRGWGRNIFVFFKPPRPGTEPRSLAWEAAVLTTTLGPPPSLSANTKHLYNIFTMLDQRRRRWADVVQMLCKLCFVFAGLDSCCLFFFTDNKYFN